MDLSEPITSLGDHPAQAMALADALKPRGGSYVSGDQSTSLIRKTMWQLLSETADLHGGRDAAVFPEFDIRWSYSELVHKCNQLAAGLLALGLNKGDRVGIWAPNRPEWLLMQFATARVGLILANINPAYRTSELEFALNKVGCTALVCARTFKSSDYVGMVREIAPELDCATAGRLKSARLPSLKTVVVMGDEQIPGTYRFSDVMTQAGPAHKSRIDEISAKLDPDDPINIQFTSGTTGSPKGATLTHYNIVNNARNVAATMNFTEQDRLCIPVPLYHCFGMVLGVLGCVSIGAAMVFPAEAFTPDVTLQAIAKERCTALFGVPTMFVAMLEDPTFSHHDLSSLRTGAMAGALCPIEVMKQVIAKMHMREVTIAYGMTETSPVSFQSFIDDPLDKRVATVGRIHPHCEVKIIDAHGLVVPIGTEGELCTRGYSVMRGYWGDDIRTSESIDAAGWMHSGDLAILDRDGYCTISGRVKDMVIRGGENIYPQEIENFLYKHPAVLEAQVFGIPDEKFGEQLCAWIILRADQTTTEDELKEFCKTLIAHYKVPKHIRFKTEMPMTVTGKPQKFLMRDAMMEELNG